MRALLNLFAELWPTLAVIAGIVVIMRLIAKARPYTCRRCGYDLRSHVTWSTHDFAGNKHMGPFPADCPRCGPSSQK